MSLLAIPRYGGHYMTLYVLVNLSANAKSHRSDNESDNGHGAKKTYAIDWIAPRRIRTHSTNRMCFLRVVIVIVFHYRCSVTRPSDTQTKQCTLKCPTYLKKAKRDKLKSNTRPTKMATDHQVCPIEDCDLRWYCLQYFRPWERACQRKVSVHWITQGKPVCSLVSKRIDTICTMFLEVCVTTMATYASIFC